MERILMFSSCARCRCRINTQERKNTYRAYSLFYTNPYAVHANISIYLNSIRLRIRFVNKQINCLCQFNEPLLNVRKYAESIKVFMRVQRNSQTKRWLNCVHSMHAMWIWIKNQFLVKLLVKYTFKWRGLIIHTAV